MYLCYIPRVALVGEELYTPALQKSHELNKEWTNVYHPNVLCPVTLFALTLYCISITSLIRYWQLPKRIASLLPRRLVRLLRLGNKPRNRL